MNTAENETWGECVGEMVICDENTGLVGGTCGYLSTSGVPVSTT